MKLCKDHVTFVAFTAKWCGHCQAMEDVLDNIKKAHSTNSDNSHFYWFDVTDPDNQKIFQAFGIKGFPTILRFDPKKAGWTKYGGERSEAAILKSMKQDDSESQTAWNSFETQEVVSHSEATDIASDEVNDAIEASDEKLELCNNHPTLLAFTGLGWCPHCVRAQKKLGELKIEAKKADSKFHVQQFDLVSASPSDTEKALLKNFEMEQTPEEQRRSKEIINQFRVNMFPLFLVFNNASDPKDQKFVQLEDFTVMSNPKALAKLFETSSKSIWKDVPTNILELSNLHASNSDDDEEDHKHTEPDDDEKDIQNKSQMQGTTPGMLALVSGDGGCLRKTKPVEPEIEVCADCITIFAFTGHWCPPCVAIHSEIDIIAANQQCGKYHFQEIEHVLSHRNANTLLAEGFGVESWPTFLIFDPTTRQFHQYLGPRNAQSIVNCDVSRLSKWPVKNLRVQFKQQQRPKRQQTGVVAAQSSLDAMREYFWGQTQQQVTDRAVHGRVKMCAHCPTVVFFALSETTFFHEKESEKTNAGIHALHFCNAKEHDTAFNLFHIRSFPMILVYCPDMNLFFEYPATYACDLKTIKTVYSSRGGLSKVWPTHPRVELIN